MAAAMHYLRKALTTLPDRAIYPTAQYSTANEPKDMHPSPSRDKPARHLAGLVTKKRGM